MIKYNNVSLCCSTNGLILDGLNFEIQEGEFFVLVGPSGSGKTTTLKLINRLIEQTDGDIHFEDKRLKDYDLRELRLKILGLAIIARSIPTRCFSPPESSLGRRFI